MRAGRDGLADGVEMRLHGLGVGLRHDEGDAGVAARTDGAEHIGVLVALILGLPRHVIPSWPIGKRGCSSGRPASRPGTRPQSAFPGRVWSRSPRPAWESFFKCRDRLRILHRMARPGAEVREAELLERATQAHLRQIDTEALSENTLQVDAAPAYDPILLRVGAGLDKLLQCLFLLVGELRRPPGRLDVDQTIR